MILALMADSHGRADKLKLALGLLKDLSPDAVVHCGDICNRQCVEILASRHGPAYLVAGNMDRHYHRLAHDARRAGLIFSPQTVEIDLGQGRYLTAAHGHDERLLAQLIAAEFTYICHGHTHERSDRRIAPTRIICPGALHRPRRSRPGIAVLDTQKDLLTFLDLPDEEQK